MLSKEDDDIIDKIQNLSLNKGQKDILEAPKAKSSQNESSEDEENDKSEIPTVETELNDSKGCVKSLKEDEEDEEQKCLYSQKGPIRNTHWGNPSAAGNTPYSKNSSGNNNDLPSLDDLNLFQNIGSFLDDVSDPAINLDTIPSPNMGIPGLPKTTKNGVNQILMNSIDDIFGKQESVSRIIFKSENGNSPFTIVPIPMSFVVDIEQKRIGIQIPRQIIPNHVMDRVSDGTIGIYVQLDPELRRVVKYTANVEMTKDPKTGQSVSVIKSQFMPLRPFKECSGLTKILDGLADNEIEAALNLFNSKESTELFKTYGPNDDTLITILCYSKEETPVTRARVLALTKKILAHPEAEKRANIIKKNKCDISPLEFAATTNKVYITPYLSELYYDIGEDIHCMDSKGNTLLHVMARKGDVVAPTLKALLDMTFNDGSLVYQTNIKNQKGQLPIHIAALSHECPQNTIQLLFNSNPQCMKAKEVTGSTPLHMACQFSTDPTMIATLLYYDRQVVNDRRKDGLTPLHMVASRSHISDPAGGIIPLSEEAQYRMIRLLLEYGGDKTIIVKNLNTNLAPYNLVVEKRTRVKILLRVRRDGSGGSGNNSPNLGSPTLVNKFVNSPDASSGIGSEFDPMSPYPNRVSPHSYMNPHSHCSDVLNNAATPTSDPYYNISPPAPIYQQFSPISANGMNSGDSPIPRGEEEDGNLDAIAEALYHHPTVQAAVKMAAADQSS